MRTVRLILWAMGEDKTMITCTGSTCPACTAVAAAMAARLLSLLQPTQSATHLSLNTCKDFSLLSIWKENCTWDCGHCGWCYRLQFYVNTRELSSRIQSRIVVSKCSCCCPAVILMKSEAFSALCSLLSKLGEGIRMFLSMSLTMVCCKHSVSSLWGIFNGYAWSYQHVFNFNRAQNANFQNSRCENTPLIGRESPPPSVSITCISCKNRNLWLFVGDCSVACFCQKVRHDMELQIYTELGAWSCLVVHLNSNKLWLSFPK